MPMVLIVSNHKRPAQKLRKPDGRAGIPASTRLRRRSNHKLPPANANGINYSETQTPSLKLRKPYGRGSMPVSAGLHKRHQPF